VDRPAGDATYGRAVTFADRPLRSHHWVIDPATDLR
jgi:hypothetical protein